MARQLAAVVVSLDQSLQKFESWTCPHEGVVYAGHGG